MNFALPKNHCSPLSRLWLVCAVVLFATEQAQTCDQAAAEQLSVYRFNELHMGTTFKLTLYAASQGDAEQAAKAALARVAELDGILSHYKEDSELSKLCRGSGSGDWVAVSDELWRMLSLSCDFSKRSDGAFDVTVGPLVQLWRRSGRRKELASDKLLSDTRARVGYRLIEFDRAKQRVRLTKRDMRIDLGGIAKGYAADEALRVLGEHGVNRALIDGGGDLMAGDPPPGKQTWTLAVAALGVETKEDVPLLELANAAAATSGDRFQFVEIGGQRYSHIIDPRTGLGVTTPSSVTVIAVNAVTADALASAVSVLGPEAGLKLIEQTPQAAALIVREEDGKTKTYRSQRLERWLRAGPTRH